MSIHTHRSSHSPRSRRAPAHLLGALLCALAPACDDPSELEADALDASELAQDELDELDELAAEEASPEALTQSELSQLLLGGNYPITNGYAPNGGHAGIDFGSVGNNVTAVRSPVSGTIIAKTTQCGKVAVYDDSNTVILAHMASLTDLPVGTKITIGTYLGRASNVVGGGCTATGSHLHIEIRTGYNTSMALPSANNTNTTRDPLTYLYSGFPPVALSSPSSGATVYSDPVTLAWQPIQGANTYRLQISTTNAFDANTCTSGCVYNSAAASTSRSVSLASGMYYWRVRAGNSGQGGLWSAVRSFKKG